MGKLLEILGFLKENKRIVDSVKELNKKNYFYFNLVFFFLKNGTFKEFKFSLPDYKYQHD